MKTIKYNRNQLKKNISKTLVTASTTLLGGPCIMWGYEPKNPKLKNLKMKKQNGNPYVIPINFYRKFFSVIYLF